MAIFNAIQFSQSYITMLAYSQASSMSGVIFQSAELRIIMPDCHFLVHHGSGGGETKHPFAVHASAEREMKACARMLDIFAKRAVEGPYFKKRKSTTIQSVRSFLDKKLKEKVDWYLDSEEAVWYGLADAVLGSKNYPNIDTLRQG
jgi:ATP-dependent protease ClpP protease subunit